MTEADSEELQLVISTQSANYSIAEKQFSIELLTRAAMDAFGENIAPLEIDFLNACQVKDVRIEDQDCDKNIGNVADFLAPKFTSLSKKTDELRKVFTRTCDIVNEVIKEQQASIHEEKNDWERKFGILRSTKPLDQEPHLEWGNYAGLDKELHATLDEVKESWRTRAAGVLRNVCSEKLNLKIKEATQRLHIPIWKQLVEGDGMQRIEAYLDSSCLCLDSTGAADLSQDYVVVAPIINRTHGARSLETPLVRTRLSIAMIHLACCKAEKERNFKFCDIQGKFVLEAETSLQAVSLPSTPRSCASLLSPTPSRTMGQPARKTQRNDMLTDSMDLTLNWTKEQRHEIYGKALDAGTIQIPGRAEWKPPVCHTWFRTGSCGRGELCTFHHSRPDNLDLSKRQVPICSHVDHAEYPCRTDGCQLLHYTEDICAARLVEAEQRNGSGKRPRPEEESHENPEKRLNVSRGY